MGTTESELGDQGVGGRVGWALKRGRMGEFEVSVETNSYGCKSTRAGALESKGWGERMLYYKML